MFRFFSKNGVLTPLEQAMIPFSNIEYAYGYGVYETLRLTQGTVQFASDHIDRLFRSAEIIELRHPFAKNQISSWMEELTKTIDERAYNLKILLIGARKPEDCLLVMLPLSPLFPNRKELRDGATAMTFAHERMFPQAKILNMFPSYYAYGKARAEGHYDALFTNRRGGITEGTRTNFFGIRGKTIVSPPSSEILEGVMRLHVLACAKENGYGIVEEDIPLSSVRELDGTFLTSTSTKIMPLRKIDQNEWNEISKALQLLIASFDKYLARLS